MRSRARPPQDAALDQPAHEHLEMLAHQFFARRLAHLGKTQLEIDVAHPAAFGGQRIGQHAQPIADGDDDAERQKMDQPENKNAKACQHHCSLAASGGNAPRGTL